MGRDCGLYVVKEGFNKRFLRQHFRNVDGNFYDGGFVTDIDEDLVRSSGQGPADNADLEALAAAAQEADAKKRWARLQSLLDVDRYLSFMAVEVMAGHWDGYTMNRNNYRVYHDPLTDKMVFLPHGMDILFTEPGSSLEPAMDGMVSRAILESREGRRRYRARVREIATNVFDVAVLTNRLDQLYARLHPVLAGFGDQAASEHVAAVQRLRDAILQRTTNLAEAIRFVPPSPLSFDSNHVAALTDWQSEDDSDRATMDRPVIDGSISTLHIGLAPKVSTIARWHSRATLPPGRYRMTGRVKTERVMPVTGRQDQGAAIRVRGAPERATVARNSPWKEVSVEFVVEQEPDEIEFSCELLGTDGAAWFDLKSLQVVRLQP